MLCAQCSAVSSRKAPPESGSFTDVMPALLTSTSTRPHDAVTWPTSRSAWAGSVRSATRASVSAPSAASSAARSWHRSVVEVSATRAPIAASSRAVAKPIPSGPPLPVTRATRLSRRKGMGVTVANRRPAGVVRGLRRLSVSR